MMRPLLLSTSRRNDYQEFLGLRDRFEKEGIDYLTMEEHERFLELSCYNTFKEFEVVGEEELGRRAERRTIEGKKAYNLGHPPIPPFFPWKWDKEKRVYVWSSGKRPKGTAGSMEGVEYLPSYIEKPSPFIEQGEGQISGEAA